MSAAKTSQSHPLRIDPVVIRDGQGAIGLTFCPGKKHDGMYSGAWERDLRTDLHAIHAFGAKALVTLMESKELDEVNVPVDLLGSYANEFSIEWHHLPIKDIHVPDDRFEDLWTYSGLRLRNILARGDKIVIHCRGGLGRTGTVAGRLLVEFGDEPEIAIKKIRAARPDSIETGQEKYVENCRPIAFARVQRSQEERALACLLGGAIGDALGYEVEFIDLREIRARFGEAGIRTPVLNQGKLIVSDDTQMTLFTMEGLIDSLKNRGTDKNAGIISSIRHAYMDWFHTQRGAAHTGGTPMKGWLGHRAEMQVRRAPGNTCLSALGSGGHGSIGKPINNSKGCGGAMRVAPIGLIGPGTDARTVFQLAAEASALTHGHPSGYLSAGVLASIIYLLVDGVNLARPGSFYGQSAIDQSCGYLVAFPGHEETLRAVKAAVSLAAKGLNHNSCLGTEPAAAHGLKDHAEAVEKLGGGWVGEEALAIALYAVLSAGSFVEAISIASNHSGDSDSTASSAGQLWGAMYGMGGMPHDWVVDLDVLFPLLHLARQFISIGFR
jgi:ADP-ribosylglycohydrolase/protein-tyrosine phosphatase